MAQKNPQGLNVEERLSLFLERAQEVDDHRWTKDEVSAQIPGEVTVTEDGTQFTLRIPQWTDDDIRSFGSLVRPFILNEQDKLTYLPNVWALIGREYPYEAVRAWTKAIGKGFQGWQKQPLWYMTVTAAPDASEPPAELEDGKGVTGTLAEADGALLEEVQNNPLDWASTADLADLILNGRVSHSDYEHVATWRGMSELERTSARVAAMDHWRAGSAFVRFTYRSVQRIMGAYQPGGPAGT